MIEVVKTKHIGFCFGVNRAVSRVLKEAERRQETVYTLGPLLHNPQVVETLREKGIVPIDDVYKLGKGVVAYRSHGIMKEEEAYIKEKGLVAIDTTCPYVKRVRQCGLFLLRNGYRVVIAGDERHPEVRSVLSYLGNDGIVLHNSFSIADKKVGVVSQTTLDVETFAKVVSALACSVKELRVYNTICESTSVRRDEAIDLAGRVDAMLVVGGKNSSNTTKLFAAVRRIQPRAYHIETEEEVRPDWLKRVKKVGIAGGASTPDVIIEKVERRVKNL